MLCAPPNLTLALGRVGCWGGVSAKGVDDRAEGKEPFDYNLNSISEQICPRCGKTVFRTGVTYKAIIGDLYVYEEEHPNVEILPIEYDE